MLSKRQIFRRWALGIALLMAVTVVLSACTPKPSVQPPAIQPMGLLKVTISGIGEGSTATASAQWVQEVNGQAATLVPVNGGSGFNDVQFSTRYVGFLDDDPAAKRSIIATFDLINRTTTNFENFTLYAVNVPGNLGGSGIISMTSASGTPFADPAAVARSFKPTHGMRPSVGSLKVNEDIADLQLFTPGEANQIKSQAISLNLLTNAATVLEYGFVGRNYSGGRVIGPRNGGDCTTNACKGTVSLAYQFPKLSPRSANPFSFSLYFLVARETDAHISQSVEEQTPNTVAGLATGSMASFAQVRTLLGSTYAGINKNHLCSVRTAVPTASHTGNAYLPSTVPTASGSLDVCFGNAGTVSTDFDGNNSVGHAVAIQSDGKIVVAGAANNGGNLDFKVVRYLPDGTLDSSFGTGGIVMTDFSSGHDTPSSVVIQPDGKIVVVGRSQYLDPVLSIFNTDLAVARLNPGGSIDTSFDGDGKTTTELGSLYDRSGGVALQPDGKIVAVGQTGASPAEPVVVLVRYNTNGSLDNTFDGDGKMVADEVRTSAWFVTIQPSGKIVVVGNTRFWLFAQRYTSTGQLDTSFGTDGTTQIVTGILTGFNSITATSIAVQPDGKIVITGTGTVGSTDGFGLGFVARIDPSGILDTSFDADGIARIDFGTGWETVNAAMIQADGKTLLLGKENDNPVLIRLNSNGSLDTSYGTGGKVPAALGSEGGEAVKMQSDGKVVVGSGPVGRLNP